MTDLGKHFTTAEVAAYFRVTPETVRDWIGRGLCSPLKLGDAKNAEYRFKQADVDALEAALNPPKPTPSRRRRRVA